MTYTSAFGYSEVTPLKTIIDVLKQVHKAQQARGHFEISIWSEERQKIQLLDKLIGEGLIEYQGLNIRQEEMYVLTEKGERELFAVVL